MNSEIIYVELKSGYSDNGPAWIGKGFYSRTRQTVYFNGQVFKRGKAIAGNHFDLESGDEYWISGVKKDGSDRHWAGGGKIVMDEESVFDYLQIIQRQELPKNKFIIERLISVPNKALSEEIENEETEPVFDHRLRFKDSIDLTASELDELVSYYHSINLSELHKKARKMYKEAMEGLEREIDRREK